MMENSKERRRP